MKNISNILKTAAIATLLTGCGDFLEPNSKSEFVPEDAQSLNELLLGEAYQRNDMSGFNIFMNLLDDDIQATPWQSPVEGFDANKYLASFSWQPDMFEMMEEAGSGHINIYESYYEVILGCNAVIDYLSEVNDTQENINKVKAQAYALRGFYYFNLVNIFAPPYNYAPTAMGVPLKLNSGIESTTAALTRSNVDLVYLSILNDLHTAEATYNDLPESLQYEKNFRTNLGMVHLLLSRVYLYMEDWEKAALYASKVMECGHFTLTDLNDIPTETPSEDGESMVRYYIAFPTYSVNETIWAYGNIDDMFSWTYEYANTTNSVTGESMHAYFQASDELLNSFSDNDLRKEHYIVNKVIGSNEDGDVYMPMPYGKVNIGTSYYTPKKESGMFGRSLRLSEAYLNYAEAKTMLGDDHLGDALNAVNELRSKRFTPENHTEIDYNNADELLEFIKAERRRELCFEGHRWFDLRRWGMPRIEHTWYDSEEESSKYVLTDKDLMYSLPIPKEAMDLNSYLEQNPLPAKRAAE